MSTGNIVINGRGFWINDHTTVGELNDLSFEIADADLSPDEEEELIEKIGDLIMGKDPC